MSFFMAQKSIGNRHRGRVIVHFEGLFPFYGSPGNIGPSRVPTIQRVGLYRFFFYSADGGKAPHAHPNESAAVNARGASAPRLRKMFKASNRQRSPSGLVTGSTVDRP